MALQKYSVVESGNVGLGQAGCEFLDTDIAAVSSPIVAITFLTDSTFDTLTPEDPSKFMGLGSGLGTNNIANTDIFPKGVTIYGRWTAVELETGRAVGYLG